MSVLDPDAVRARFPVLDRTIRGRPPIYLDSACTTLRPEPVIRAMADFQRLAPACHGRSGHRLGREATDAYEGARERIARFFGAGPDHTVVFTRNTTEGINLVAAGLAWRAGDAVLTTNIEHNSNLLPWQRIARVRGVRHGIHRVDIRRGLDLQALDRDLTADVRLVAFPLVSNLCGIEFPAAEIAERAHARGALVLVDAAQAPLTHPLDMDRLGADFAVLSFHKMFGPAGVGALCARTDLLEGLEPWLVGGGTVLDASFTEARWAAPPDRFDAGVANVEGAVGAAAAADFVEGIGGPRAIRDHVVGLNARATEALGRYDRVHILGPDDPTRRNGILNFHVDGLHSEALARVMDTRHNVMVRHGKHCVHPWYHAEGVPDSVRASFCAYNTAQEVARLVRTVGDALALLE